MSGRQQSGLGLPAHSPRTSPELAWAPHRIRQLKLVPRRITRLAYVALLVSFLVLPACDSEPATLSAVQKTASTSRTAAATELRKAFYAKNITANGAINLAHARFDPSTTPPASPTVADVEFAGAVLDFIAQCEPDIDKKVLNEFFWMRLGTLAANAAAAAEAMGNTPLARSVVLAGPKRWQNDVYWRQCPSHDALASIILFKSGEGPEAIHRLQDRPDLADEVQQAKAMIEQEMRKGGGRKP